MPPAGGHRLARAAGPAARRAGGRVRARRRRAVEALAGDRLRRGRAAPDRRKASPSGSSAARTRSRSRADHRGRRPAGARSHRHRSAQRDPGARGSGCRGLERLRAAACRGRARHADDRHFRADQPVALGAAQSDRRGRADASEARLPAVPQADLPHRPSPLHARHLGRAGARGRRSARSAQARARPRTAIRSTAARTSSTGGIAPSAPTISILPAPSGPCWPGLGADEDRDQRHAERGREMQQPGVDADHEGGARDHARHAVERLEVRHAARPARRRRSRSLRRRSASVPHGSTTAIRAAASACASSIQRRHRPFLLGPRGRVQQDRVARAARAGQRRAIEPKIGRPVRRISERHGGQQPVARDRVQRAVDPMMHVVEPCAPAARARSRGRSRAGGRARTARSAPSAPGPARRSPSSCVCVAHRARNARDLAPGRRAAAAARRQRRDATGMTLSTARCSRTSGAKASSTTQPMRASGRCAARVAHRRHVMDHVAERGRLDEQDIGHRAREIYGVIGIV